MGGWSCQKLNVQMVSQNPTGFSDIFCRKTGEIKGHFNFLSQIFLATLDRKAICNLKNYMDFPQIAGKSIRFAKGQPPQQPAAQAKLGNGWLGNQLN